MVTTTAGTSSLLSTTFQASVSLKALEEILNESAHYVDFKSLTYKFANKGLFIEA
jgi:hypothetical protein